MGNDNETALIEVFQPNDNLQLGEPAVYKLQAAERELNIQTPDERDSTNGAALLFGCFLLVLLFLGFAATSSTRTLVLPPAHGPRDSDC